MSSATALAATTALALLAFAANSLLCRYALADGSTDPASFTALRLASGALVLAALMAFRSRGVVPERATSRAGWRSAFALFAYAAGFSLAYVAVGAATGALLPFAAVEGVDAVVTDCWVSMGDDDEAHRHNLLSPYQVNAKLMAAANPDAIFMHCLPAHRGEEVTADVMDGPRSVVFDEAENRLHAQKGILAWCLGANGL